MQAISLIEIPYHSNAQNYLESLLHLPQPILFDSGLLDSEAATSEPNAQHKHFDIFTASPLYTLNLSRGILEHSEQGKQKLKPSELSSYLNQQLKQEHIDDALLPELGLPFYGGFAGYCAYDLDLSNSKAPRVDNHKTASSPDLPELLLGFYPWAGILDHYKKQAWLSFLPNCPEPLKHTVQQCLSQKRPSSAYLELEKFKLINDLESNFDVSSYQEKIAAIQEYILSGDCYQVNFSQCFSAEYDGHPWSAYTALSKVMKAPFGGYFETNKNNQANQASAILSFSPERFLELRNRQVLTEPIKGTAKRHADKQQDQEIASKLQNSEKDKAENLMIVDLLRNDLGRCCEYGSIKTEKLFELQSFSNVHHLVSQIRGTLQPGKTAVDLLQATFPGGSITGAPKIRAMEIINELEPHQREIYCGSLLYININGDMDSNIAIRTVQCHNHKIQCWGGGGIVADSNPEAEYNESLIKINPLLQALEQFQ